MWLIKLFFFGKSLEPLEVGSWHQQETLTRLMLVWREETNLPVVGCRRVFTYLVRG